MSEPTNGAALRGNLQVRTSVLLTSVLRGASTGPVPINPRGQANTAACPKTWAIK